jgi:hypothetical protein
MKWRTATLLDWPGETVVCMWRPNVTAASALQRAIRI